MRSAVRRASKRSAETWADRAGSEHEWAAATPWTLAMMGSALLWVDACAEGFLKP